MPDEAMEQAKQAYWYFRANGMTPAHAAVRAMGAQTYGMDPMFLGAFTHGFGAGVAFVRCFPELAERWRQDELRSAADYTQSPLESLELEDQEATDALDALLALEFTAAAREGQDEQL